MKFLKNHFSAYGGLICILGIIALIGHHWVEVKGFEEPPKLQKRGVAYDDVRDSLRNIEQTTSNILYEKKRPEPFEDYVYHIVLELFILGFLVFCWEGLHQHHTDRDKRKEAVIQFFSSLRIFADAEFVEGRIRYTGIKDKASERLQSAMDLQKGVVPSSQNAITAIHPNEYLFYNLGTLYKEAKSCSSVFDQTHQLQNVLGIMLRLETLNDRYGFLVGHALANSVSKGDIQNVLNRFTQELHDLDVALKDLLKDWEKESYIQIAA